MQAIQLSRRGLVHPEPKVRDAAAEWADVSFKRWSPDRIVLLVAMALVAVFGWSRMLHAPLVMTAIPVAAVVIVIVNTHAAMVSLRRVSHDPGAQPPTESEFVRLTPVGDVRTEWLLRASIMIVGFPLGSIMAVVGIGVFIGGGGNRIIPAIVVLGGLLLVGGAVLAVKAQRTTSRAPE